MTGGFPLGLESATGVAFGQDGILDRCDALGRRLVVDIAPAESVGSSSSAPGSESERFGSLQTADDMILRVSRILQAY